MRAASDSVVRAAAAMQRQLIKECLPPPPPNPDGHDSFITLAYESRSDHIIIISFDRGKTEPQICRDRALRSQWNCALLSPPDCRYVSMIHSYLRPDRKPVVQAMKPSNIYA